MADKQIFQLGAGAILGTNVVPHQDASGVLDAVKNTWDQVRAFNSGRKMYCFGIIQTGAGNPTITEYLNQTGAIIVWTRFNAGLFIGTASAAVFLTGKVPAQQVALVDPDNHVSGYKMAEIFRYDDTHLYMYLQDSFGVSTDDIPQAYFEVPIFY